MENKRGWLGLIAGLALVLAACGDGGAGDTTAAPAPDTTAAPAPDTTAAPAPDTTAAPAPDTTGAAPTGGLAGVCPDPIVIQTDWFPEAEHGALYQMVGSDYQIDKDAKVVTGSLTSGGQDLGVDIEVRTGGPAIGFQAVSTQMYTDDSIHFGYVSSDEAILGYADAPTLAVIAPLEKNPQIIMWDPETYPEIETIAQLGEEGVLIQYFAGGVFMDVFVAQGILSQDQIDPSYDGSPARFVAEGGAIAQQAFASAEPYIYENEVAEWGRPIAFELIHDAGFQVYSQPLAIKSADLETLRPCLEQFVPIVQTAVVEYVADPSTANALIVETVDTFDDFWVYSDGVAEFSIAKQVELGLVGNGADSTVGNMEDARVQTVIDQITGAGMEVSEGLTAADIVTNEFIDTSIGLP
jgi:hypothetical protein